MFAFLPRRITCKSYLHICNFLKLLIESKVVFLFLRENISQNPGPRKNKSTQNSLGLAIRKT